jgi:hypothetical protein
MKASDEIERLHLDTAELEGHRAEHQAGATAGGLARPNVASDVIAGALGTCGC